MSNNLVNLSELTAAQVAELLTQVRKAEKEKKAKIQALPMFAYILVMTDSSLVYWSGKAQDVNEATDKAKAHATKGGKEVFAMCPRPLPAPRGRKAATSDDTQGDAS